MGAESVRSLRGLKMTYYEPRTFFDPDNLNFTGRAFYECTQGYSDMMSPGMDILQDSSQPWLLDKLTREQVVCPVNRTCVPAGDANGMYVRDTGDNKLYFSDAGWQRYDQGATIDWVGVLHDLLFIMGERLARLASCSQRYRRCSAQRVGDFLFP